METANKISRHSFYGEYHGHRVVDLEAVHAHLKRDSSTSLIFLAGDSTLDNKFWFTDTGPAVNGYEKILDQPYSRLDISHWLNKHLADRNLKKKMAAINCAIEESTVGARACGRLLPQDKFIRDVIQENDILVVSLGGNDIALAPSPCTIFSVASLICCSTTNCIETCTCGCALPCDDCCSGFGFGCLSNACGWPLGAGYLIHLFSIRIQSLISKMTEKKKPKLIFVCMLYFLDEAPVPSWAGLVLRALGYDSNPRKIQAMIRQLFRLATTRISIPGSQVVAVPMFECLDGKDTTDYVQRVEPSAKGGEKLGKFLIDTILSHIDNEANAL